jgi:hypothetical protein
MATHAVSGTDSYSGVTTTTDTDILTLAPIGGLRGKSIRQVRVTNRHASATLLVSTNGTSPSAVGDGVVQVKPGLSEVVNVRTRGAANGSAEVRLTGSAACDYNAIAVY